MVVLAMTDLGAARGAGDADWELEEFLRRREIDGTLAVLRRHGHDLAAKRCRKAQETESEAIESSRAQEAEKAVLISDKISATKIAELKESPSASSLSPSDRLTGFDGDEWDDPWTDTEDGSSITYSDGVDGDGFRLEDLPDVQPLSVCFTSNTGDHGVDEVLNVPGFETDGAVAKSPHQQVATLADRLTSRSGSDSPTGTDMLPWPLKADQAAAACIGSADTRSTNRGPVREDDVASCDHFDDGDVVNGSSVTATDLQSFLERLRIPEAALESHGWQHLMTRATPTMQYSSHSSDCAIEGYPKSTCYRGRMVVEGVTLETVRDFLLDDEFRGEWDENRLESTVLEDWNEAGVCVVRWVRRLPFFLRNREYVVSRRVWSLSRHTPSEPLISPALHTPPEPQTSPEPKALTEPRPPQEPQTPPEPRTSLARHTFFCINRHTSHPSAVSRPSLLRVPYFYSSWRIRYVPGRECEVAEPGENLAGQRGRLEGEASVAEGQGGDADQNRRNLGVEIVTYHQEESGMPRELTRVAVVRGMWGHMLGIEAALRNYCQAQRTVRNSLPPFLLTNDS